MRTKKQKRVKQLVRQFSFTFLFFYIVSFMYFPVSPINSVKVSSCFGSLIKEAGNINNNIKSYKYVHDHFGMKKLFLWVSSTPYTPSLTSFSVASSTARF